jgi:triacylglycerol lipase
MKCRWFAAPLFVLMGASSASAAPEECVILLHGLARTSYSMVPLEEALQERLYAVANIDYPSREQPIESLAPEAIGRGLAACRSCDAKVIHFVTHSMGGILVRQYLAGNTIPELGRVVMLAPPNQGSEVVDRFSTMPGYKSVNGPAGYQLGTGPGSVPILLGPVTYPVGVIAGTESVNFILSTAFSDANDGKVSVERTRVEGMSDFMTVEASHPFIMRNDEAILHVLTFLEFGRFIREAP